MARKRRLPAPENKDRWLISYADFVTLLLALFVVLFASSQPDKRKVRQVADSVTQALLQGERLAPGTLARSPEMEYLDKALARANESGRIEVHRASRGFLIG